MVVINLQSSWWRRYRRHQFSIKKKQSTEVIIRQSLRETIVEYFKNCSIAGMDHICSPTIGRLHRTFWLLIFAMALVVLSYCVRSIWSSLSIPLIVTMESTTYPIKDIDFPAVVLCNVNRISRLIAAQVAANLYFMNKDDRKFNEMIKSVEEVEWNLIQFGRLIDFEYTPELAANMTVDFGVRDGWDTHVVTALMLTFAPDCDKMLIHCSWMGEHMPCDQLFQYRRTSRGFCCAFNYVLDDGESNYNASTQIKRQTIAGPLHGLTVVLDPQVDDYAYPMHHMKGFDVLLFDPKHYPDATGGRTIHRFVGVNMVNQLEIQSRKQLATKEVRKYSPTTRNCLFEDERYDEFGGMYSMSACIFNCRIETLQSLCKCTPFFLPLGDNEGSVCTMADLWCLNKYREKFMYLHPMNPDTKDGLELELQDSLYCPDCLPDCEHTQHYSRSNLLPILTDEWKEKIFKIDITRGLNITGKSVLGVFQSTADGTLDRLDVVLYWFEILSNFGGFAGILLGLSLATGYEWLFYFIIFFAKTVVHKIYENRAL